jgi:hypothetical protein
LLDVDCEGVLVEYRIDCADSFSDECGTRRIRHVDGSRSGAADYRDASSLILVSSAASRREVLGAAERCRMQHRRERVYIAIVVDRGLAAKVRSVLKAVVYSRTLSERPVLLSVVGGRAHGDDILAASPEETGRRLSLARYLKYSVEQWLVAMARLARLDYVLFRA